MEIRLAEIKEQFCGLKGNYIISQEDEQKGLCVLWASEGVSAMLGYEQEEFEARLSEITQSEFWGVEEETARARIKIRVESKEELAFSTQLENKRGELLWVNARSRVLGTLEGKLVFVTQLFPANDMANTIGMLSDLNQDIVFVLAEDTYKLLYVNDRYLEWAGTTRENALTHCCYEVCRHSDGSGKPCGRCKPLEAYLAGGELRAVEEADSCYHIKTKKLEWGGRPAYAVTIVDVSEQRQLEKVRLEQYNARIYNAVRTTENVFFVYGANLSKNTISVIPVHQQAVIFAEGQSYDEVVAWMASKIYNPEQRERFEKDFNRERLLELFEKGFTSTSLEVVFSKSEMDDCLIKAKIFMRQNPITLDTEANFLCEDISFRYTRGLVTEYMMHHAYDKVSVLDLKYKQMTHFKSGRFAAQELANRVPYDAFIEEYAQNNVLKDERKQFIQNASLDNVVQKLSEQEVYSFMAHSTDETGIIDYNRYSYAYIEPSHRTVIVTIEDETMDFEIDDLTGLYKYNGFCIRAGELIQKKDKTYAILFFNISGFKAVNELFGNEAGDLVLQEMTKRLKNSKMQACLLGRIAVTDHFLCLVEEKNVLFNEIKKMCHLHMNLEGKNITVHAQCGIYMVHDTNMSVDRMCDQAKIAKNHVQDEYVKPYAVFDEKMKEAYLSKTNAVTIVNQALDNGEFCVFYQPIYDAKTGQIASAEALVRWNRPMIGMVSPGMFIPALEESGFISLVDQFVARSVRYFQETRLREKKFTVPVSINLSWIDFYDENVMESVMEDIHALDEHHGMLRYEVTETGWAAMNSRSSVALRNMREKGVKILLDDFGSGYSSFSTIRDYDFDILKIDMGFIQKLGKDEKVDGITCAIIDMAHHIRASVVAEGVETEEQRAFLSQNGCDYLQGYYFHKPIPEDAFIALLDEHDEEDRGA